MSTNPSVEPRVWETPSAHLDVDNPNPSSHLQPPLHSLQDSTNLRCPLHHHLCVVLPTHLTTALPNPQNPSLCQVCWLVTVKQLEIHRDCVTHQTRSRKKHDSLPRLNLPQPPFKTTTTPLNKTPLLSKTSKPKPIQTKPANRLKKRKEKKKCPPPSSQPQPSSP